MSLLCRPRKWGRFLNGHASFTWYFKVCNAAPESGGGFFREVSELVDDRGSARWVIIRTPSERLVRCQLPSRNDHYYKCRFEPCPPYVFCLAVIQPFIELFCDMAALEMGAAFWNAKTAIMPKVIQGNVYRLDTDTGVLYLTPKTIGVEVCDFYIVNEVGELKYINVKGARDAKTGALKMTPATKILTAAGRLKKLQETDIGLAQELPQQQDTRPPAALRTDRAMRKRI